MLFGKRRHLIQPGELAPGFRLAKLGGETVTLSELISGGPAAYVFFKISCPTCQLAFPYLERIHQAGGLPIYGISQNNAEDTRAFAERFKLTLPMLLDDEAQRFPASNAYGISSVPTMFLVETDGLVSSTTEGWSKADIEKLGNRAGFAVFRQGDNPPAWKAG